MIFFVCMQVQNDFFGGNGSEIVVKKKAMRRLFIELKILSLKIKVFHIFMMH